ncbi:MAG TPA: SDR family oxidoreductase [Streptosporangiaceae bacterium]|nr:SDR family oxidoreductase [Streptosporangiaceae bacterium]
MEITGKVAVVTGGASGVGRALCRGLAERGAAGVVVCDIDGEGAAKVAAEIEAGGHRAIAVQADVSKEADVQALVASAEALGPVGLFFSNAGIIVAGGPEASDEAWARIWAINVQSHIYVARAVLPGMLARGGYLEITASAAGLLTQLGSAPYAVTKHAAVAFAEWLSITYGDQGIVVSCLCPQAFTSNLLATSRRELGAGELPDADGWAGGSAQAAVDGVLTSEQVAAAVLDAVGTGQFLILPHPDVATYERRRADDRERWLHGMRRMQARLSREPQG